MRQIFHVVGMMNVGGTETMLMNLYRKIDRTKFQFIFVTFGANKGAYDDEINQLGGIVYNVGSPYSFLAFLKLKKQFPNADVAHLHTYFNCGVNALWFKLLGVKKIISHSHTSLSVEGRFLTRCYKWACQLLIDKLSTQKLACSKSAASALFGEEENYTYLPNFIDPVPFIEAKKIKKTSSIQVGHVARFTEVKNHKFILELARYAKQKDYDMCFNLVGDGDLLPVIKAQIQQHKLQDYICLHGASDNIAQMMSGFDCFILPSTVEGFGLVLLEAQAANLPCIVSQAIQPEAILDLGLVKYLDFDVKKWVEEISFISKGQYTSSDILSAFNRAGLDFNSVMNKLEDIYEK